MSTNLYSAIDALVPAGPEAGRWDDVLARAGVRRRSFPRARWMALAVLTAVIALVATPAFGIQGLVLDLLRRDVSFANSRSAPNEVKKQFADLALGAPVRWAPQVEAAQARLVATFSIAGHPRKLWVAPTRRGGYCYTFERSFGGCRRTRADRAVGVNRFGVTWQGAPPRSRGTVEFATRVGGDVTVPAAARITARYADGTTANIPFVWVSKPIAAGFFTYDVPTAHWSKGRRLRSLTLFARDGRRLGSQSFPVGRRPKIVPLPRGRVRGPRERHLPTQPPVGPAPPLQTGSADGFAVVVGRNGAVQFTQTGTTPILRTLVGKSAGFGCFRLTREFGIFTVRGLGDGGRFAPRVGFLLNGVGGPLDGCEVQASIGRTWPDSLGNHAAVEIPFTAAGRRFFADRAAARDVALFVRSRRMHRLRAEPPARALADIRRAYGKQLAGSRIRIEAVVGGLRCSERSPTGREFFVLVNGGKIARQNLKPYAFVF
ncbi:MAG: hypothetical protein ACJ77E_02275 [Gaiellaceae bacterium]